MPINLKSETTNQLITGPNPRDASASKKEAIKTSLGRSGSPHIVNLETQELC